MREIICSICGKPAPHTHTGESYYVGSGSEEFKLIKFDKEKAFELGYKKGKADEAKKYELSYDQIFELGRQDILKDFKTGEAWNKEEVYKRGFRDGALNGFIDACSECKKRIDNNQPNKKAR